MLKKCINIIIFIWFAIGISTIQHPIIFGTIMTKAFGGIIFLIFLALVLALGIFMRNLGAIVGSIFALLLYIGIVWTKLPVSKLMNNSDWLFVPWALFGAINVFDFGKRVKRKR